MFSIKRGFLKWRKTELLLEKYYPKNTYDRLARREMKSMLTLFNDIFFDAYPRMLAKQPNIVIDYYPKVHSKQYEVQRAVKLFKAHKIRRKDLTKIEELLNLQYVIEEQLDYYDKEIKKSRQTQKFLDEEPFESFFSELHEKRIGVLLKMEAHYLKRVKELHIQKETCGEAITELLHSKRSIWGEASKLLGEMVSDSVKHVIEAVDRSLKKY